jgi:hypothetical protein
MKLRPQLLIAASIFLLAAPASATMLCVDLNNTNPVPPYTNWITAATNIQDAVDAATPGDHILVTNGVYDAGATAVSGSSNRVALIKPVVVQSVNGPDVTVIRGRGPKGPAAIRCAYLTNGAMLAGFTLTNGATYTSRGAGVWCESLSAVVSNCVLAGNAAYSSGGGAHSGTLINCALTGNSAGGNGGGADSAALSNCTLTGNWAADGGGAYGCTLDNCTLAGNTAYGAEGGGGGHGGGAHSGTLRNCTLTGNAAYFYTSLGGNGPGWGGGAHSSTLLNSILCYNSSFGGNCFGGTLNYCCTTPLPTVGTGNITNAPLFVNLAGGNVRLQTNSPCINAGRNAYAPGALDLDGNPRISGGTVDLGAYELPFPASLLSYAWARQFGLPTDGSADYADADSDGNNNWQEWMAGTDPTNAASALRLQPPAVVPPSLLLRWTSVTSRFYSVEQAAAAGATPAFSLLRSNIAGQPGTTSFTDTNPLGGPPRLYRVRVEP